MLPGVEFAAVHPPMQTQIPLPQAAPRQLDSPFMDDDDDDKGKISRWQIGSTSLNVLEQVYQMEPFPGAHFALRLATPSGIGGAAVYLDIRPHHTAPHAAARRRRLLAAV